VASQGIDKNLANRARRTYALHNANASGPSGTPAVGSVCLTHAGSGLADTVDHYPAHAAAHASLRDRVVGLMDRPPWWWRTEVLALMATALSAAVTTTYLVRLLTPYL
jgi:hypothetical protein